MRNTTMSQGSAMTETLKRIPGVALMLFVCMLVFSVLNADFLSIANLTNIGVQSTILLMISLPMTLVIMAEGIDMSIGALLTFAVWLRPIF